MALLLWVKNHPVDSIDSVTLDGWLGGRDGSIAQPVEDGLAVEPELLVCAVEELGVGGSVLLEDLLDGPGWC